MYGCEKKKRSSKIKILYVKKNSETVYFLDVTLNFLPNLNVWLENRYFGFIRALSESRFNSLFSNDLMKNIELCGLSIWLARTIWGSRKM